MSRHWRIRGSTAGNYGGKVCVESCTLDMGHSTPKEFLLWPFCSQSFLFLISLLFQIFQSCACLQQLGRGRRCWGASLRIMSSSVRAVQVLGRGYGWKTLGLEMWCWVWLTSSEKRRGLKWALAECSSPRAESGLAKAGGCHDHCGRHISHPIQHCPMIQNSTGDADRRCSSRIGSTEGSVIVWEAAAH